MTAVALTGLKHVRTEIARACRDANRDPSEVTLIAVSKTFTAGAIEPAIAEGQRNGRSCSKNTAALNCT
jgi:uncharacterized pyridoxal phosphate-containing UPF0001 family protein